MGNAAEDLSADDVWPIAKRLAPEERARLARRLLEERSPEELAAIAAKRKAAIGRFAGKIEIAEDFDAPLPPEIQRYFDGEDDDERVKP